MEVHTVHQHVHVYFLSTCVIVTLLHLYSLRCCLFSWVFFKYQNFLTNVYHQSKYCDLKGKHK